MSNPLTNIDLRGDTLVVRRTQDVDPVLRAVRAERAATGGRSKSGEMMHAATLPMVVIEQYCNANNLTFQEWMNNPEHARRMLNDPALAAFRVWEGRA
ncbi:MAG TPA: hypothetical protein VFM34_05175 [Moraxellaceae bacterium]|nr:hypothetical protein [Moraxellaceae bacterium]